VIGISDGLTVPLAPAARLIGAVQNTELIVITGIAEIAAGSIAREARRLSYGENRS